MKLSKWNSTRTIILIVVFLQFVNSPASSLSAQTPSYYTTWGSESSTIGFQVSSIYGFEPNETLALRAVNSMDGATRTWTNSGSGVNANNPDTGRNIMTIASKTESWYGLCTRKWFLGYYYSIDINYRRIKEDATNLQNFIRSVTVHELGHVFSLSDNPGTTASIMSYSRNRNTMIQPQTIDITRVRNKYQ